MFQAIFVFWFSPLRVSLKFEGIIQWLLRYSTLNILRSSSIGGRLQFKYFLILVWSPEHEVKIWGRYEQWLLRYSTFNIFGLSSIGGCLHFKIFLFWFGPLSINNKFEKDLISGCWDIQILLFWGRL